MSAIHLTKELATFVSSLDASKTPPEARRRTIDGFIDCIGVMTVGAREPPPLLLRKVLSKRGGPATLWGDGERASVAEAALINATAAHALDYDDTGLKGHPSAVIVPALLATAEECGASGSQLVTAYLAGYETWAELIYREIDQHPSKGWHITGIFGAIGAAAACASLRRLDSATTTMALSIAASQSSGLLANFGTMTKPLHAGLASRAGVFAVELAAAGMTASDDAFEHPQGFLAAVSPAGRYDITSPLRAGKEWRMLSSGLNVKKYPICYCSHRSVDGALYLRERYSINAADVASIKVLMSKRNATILRHHKPRSGLEAKFSIEFAMASAFIAGHVGLGQLTDEFVQREDVQKFFPRVTTWTDVESDQSTGHGIYDKVEVRLHDGRVFESGEIKAARGAANLPLTRDEIFHKFADCLRASRSALNAQQFFETIAALEQVPLSAVVYAQPENTAV